MKLKNYILTGFTVLIGLSVSAQYGSQKKADNLFNTFSFVNAAKVYHKLIDKNHNADYAVRQLADSYAYMRNPDSAVVYYEKAVIQNNVPIHYYYNYAQALRGVKDYKASRSWMKKFKNAGGKIDRDRFLKDADFINAIFNAKQQYFLTDVNFNSKYSDFGAYEHEGVIYFASSRDERVSTKHIYGWNGEPFLDVYTTSNRTDSLVNHKAKLKGKVNSIYHDGPITLSKDGTTMYFSRNDFNKQVLGKADNGMTNLKIYKATLANGQWINITELEFNDHNYSVSHPALNNDETKLYFCSDMPGGYGGSDIYYITINDDGTYGDIQNAGAIVNTDKDEKFPFINSEGVLFFASDGHPGLGMLDIFGTILDENNNISGIINLGVPVNSNKDDFSFFMNNDGLSGYFASNRSGGKGSDDIYAYDRIPNLTIDGVIKDVNTNLPLADVTIMLLDSNGNKIAELQTDEKGLYDINIDRDADYVIKAKKENYIEHTQPVSSKGIARSVTRITTNVMLNEIEEIPIAELYPIYFDFNKYDIRNDGTAELNRIVNLMVNEYPEMIIKIESHTDSRGSANYNIKLSQERATATYNYLVKMGIDPSRITTYEGLGEQQLTNHCDGSVDCTEDEHQLNRRTQFIVIKMK